MSETPRPSPPVRERDATPAPAASAGERRYTEEELALILNRAAERQEGVQASAPRYTLADIQEIAAGAGIAPEHVSSVAAALGDARAPSGGGVLGAPHRFRFEESIEGELADDVIGELFDLVRRTLGAQGAVTEALGTVEWKGRDTMGWSYVSVARRGGRTTIGVLSLRTDAAGVAGSLAGTGAVLGSLGLGAAAVSLVSVAAPIAAATGIGAALGGVWIATRVAWRRYARRVGGQIETLGSALVAAARSAVADGRVRGR
ncbi:MAG: hypothetical protein JF589_00340 [Gemmatimonadetes bacterium]|nr:hypothetical protein [Gemmatimonadota bacterium]